MLPTHCFLGIPQGSTAVYYLVLDVKESDCSVLSRKHWDDCEPAVSIRPSDTVSRQGTIPLLLAFLTSVYCACPEWLHTRANTVKE